MKQVAQQVFAIQRGDLGWVFRLKRGFGLLDLLPEMLQVLAGDAARFRADGQKAPGNHAQPPGGIAPAGEEYLVEQGQILAQVAPRGAGVDHLAVVFCSGTTSIRLGREVDRSWMVLASSGIGAATACSSASPAGVNERVSLWLLTFDQGIVVGLAGKHGGLKRKLEIAAVASEIK